MDMICVNWILCCRKMLDHSIWIIIWKIPGTSMWPPFKCTCIEQGECDANNWLGCGMKQPETSILHHSDSMIFVFRYLDYCDALAHILNTGQGVVLERSCYSDFVFVEAMFKAGHVSKQFHRAYYEIRANTIEIALKPHLVIYLDVPVDVVQVRHLIIYEFREWVYRSASQWILFQFQSNIKARGNENEINSEVLKAKSFHEDIEYFYKHEFLKDISAHSELLVYDWSHGGEPEVVTEDVVRIGKCHSSSFPWFCFWDKETDFSTLFSSQISIIIRSTIWNWRNGVSSSRNPTGLTNENYSQMIVIY